MAAYVPSNCKTVLAVHTGGPRVFRAARVHTIRACLVGAAAIDDGTRWRVLDQARSVDQHTARHIPRADVQQVHQVPFDMSKTFA